jgi:hypothetical protein
MPNRFQIKRTTTTGLLPNVSNVANTSYIAAGELAINLTDRKLLSSNGSATFEIGANLATIVVGTGFTQTSGNANFDSGVLFVDGTNNRVGVGTTSPTHVLHANGSSAPILAENSGGGTYMIDMKANTGTYNVRLGNAGDTFLVNVNNAERMRIDSTGNVGIGTADPMSARLVVVSPANSPSLLLTDNTQSTLTIKHETGNLLTYEVNGTATHRWVSNSLERMRITGSGNVGIGNTNPAHVLSVTGTTNLDGAVTGITTLAAGNTTVTGFVSANNAYANGTTGQSFRATTPGVAQGEKSALTMYATFTGSGDNGPRRVADIVGGYIGGTWGNETLTFHVGTGAQNDNANTTTQRLLVNATSFAANNLAFSGITTLAAGNTSITGFITATGDITAFFSDDRLKDRYSNIPNAVEKVKSLNGFYYEPNITAQDLGYQKEMHVGVSAQEVNAIMPEVVAPAPIDNKYMTVKYDRLIPLLIEAIKEQQIQIDELKAQLNKD